MPDSQALYVHRAPADEVLDQAHELRGAGGVYAVGHRLALGTHQPLAAARALCGHYEGLLVARSLVLYDADDLRDDLARPLDDHQVSRAQVLLTYIVLIVKGGLADGRSAHVDGLQDGVGVDAARAAHVDAYLIQAGQRAGGWELVGDCPPWLAAHCAHMPLEVERVDLDDDAVAPVVETFERVQPAAIVVEGFLGSLDGPVFGIGPEAEPDQVFERLPVGVRHGSVRVAEAVHEYVEASRCGDPRIELPDGAGGGVAGVRVGGKTGFIALPVQLGEPGLREEHLAPHFEASRHVLQQPQRDAPDRAKVGGHVLAHGPVPAGCASCQHAVLVGEGDRQPVELELAHHAERLAVDEGLCAAVPRHELLFVEGVAQAEHRPEVDGLGESGDRLRADALGGRVRRHEIGVPLLDGPQLIEERVELGVAYLGRVEGVVAVVVVVDAGPELFEPALNVRVYQGVICWSCRCDGGAEPLSRCMQPCAGLVQHGG